MQKKKHDPKWKEMRRHRRGTSPYKVTFKKNGIAVDITDWTVYFTVKKEMNSADSEAVIAKKIVTHSDPGNGETLITFTASETELVGSYYYSIEYKDDDSNEGVLVYGRIEFEDTVRKTRN